MVLEITLNLKAWVHMWEKYLSKTSHGSTKEMLHKASDSISYFLQQHTYTHHPNHPINLNIA
jgi:hypothetical protein